MPISKTLPILSVVAFILLAACSTPYQPAGFKGGYSDTQLSDDQFVVSFRGNGYTSEDKVRNSLLYRCAQLAKEQGYDYFAILGGQMSTSTSTYQTAGTYSGTTQVYGNTAYSQGTYTPGATIPINRHRGEARIKLYKEGSQHSGDSVFSAEKLMKYVGPKIGISG